jgi:hypothetical protein
MAFHIGGLLSRSVRFVEVRNGAAVGRRTVAVSYPLGCRYPKRLPFARFPLPEAIEE